MKLKPYKATAVGFLLYALLFVVTYLSGNGSEPSDSLQVSWLGVIAGLAAWCLPGLVTGTLTQNRAIVAGTALGFLILAFDFTITALISGFDTAFAVATLFPEESLFPLLSAVVFAYTGWKLQRLNFQGTKPNAA